MRKPTFPHCNRKNLNSNECRAESLHYSSALAYGNRMSELVVVKAGTTFPNTAQKYGDFEDWTCKGLGVALDQVCLVDAQRDDCLPSVRECSGVVVTGSHSMVSDELDWSNRLCEWITGLVDSRVPFLGICYGHQLLAKAVGGTAGPHLLGKEIGTVEVGLLPESSIDRLFRGLPPRFLAHVTHSETVLSLPENATRLAANSFDSYHAIRVADCAWGVQFHPEYDARIMKSYVEEQAEELKVAERNLAGIYQSVRDTPEAASILRRFSRIVNEGQRHGSLDSSSPAASQNQ